MQILYRYHDGRLSARFSATYSRALCAREIDGGDPRTDRGRRATAISLVQRLDFVRKRWPNASMGLPVWIRHSEYRNEGTPLGLLSVYQAQGSEAEELQLQGHAERRESLVQ